MLDIVIDPSWSAFFEIEKEQTYFNKITSEVELAYEQSVCFPPKGQIFNAFKYCSLSNLKVVIIGQDPYHGAGEAHGLAFSVPEGVAIPPSLRNIFIEIQNSQNTVFFPNSGNLERWAKQGVLLLNTTLTVKQNEPNSHKNIPWQTFTNHVIQYISKEKDGIVFLLWGGFAQKKKTLIDVQKHFILESGHPSPLSANRGFWFGNNHFNKTNQILKNQGKIGIEW